MKTKIKKAKPKILPPGPANQLTADQYLEHWKARKVWLHLEKPRHQKRLRWCAEQCEGEALADVGCMYGHSTAIMAGFRPGRWTGIDFSAEAIEKARKLFPGLEFFYYPEPKIMAWPLAGRFDTVVCSEVLEHVENDREFLKILLDIAKRKIVLTTPAVDAQDPGHVRIYTGADLAVLLADVVPHGWEMMIDRDESFFYATLGRPQ